MPQLAEGLRIYAIGDVHGRADLLERLFALIDADIEQRPGGGARFRSCSVIMSIAGPRRAKVIDLILARAERHELVALKGNHDALLLQAIDDPACKWVTGS